MSLSRHRPSGGCKSLPSPDPAPLQHSHTSPAYQRKHKPTGSHAALAEVVQSVRLAPSGEVRALAQQASTVSSHMLTICDEYKGQSSSKINKVIHTCHRAEKDHKHTSCSSQLHSCITTLRSDRHNRGQQNTPITVYLSWCSSNTEYSLLLRFQPIR